ncbi:hypothetical protein Hdeb2414_s0005g00161591 [Helianthus debilis subsp. tardiflorus]
MLPSNKRWFNFVLFFSFCGKCCCRVDFHQKEKRIKGQCILHMWRFRLCL